MDETFYTATQNIPVDLEYYKIHPLENVHNFLKWKCMIYGHTRIQNVFKSDKICFLDIKNIPRLKM